MKYRLQCKQCSEIFVHIGSSYPSHCQLCFAYVGLDGRPEVALPFISKAANKSPDQLYKAMEEGAQHRVHLAAEATGLPASDFAGLKHTNMQDNLREGDVSHAPVKPANMDAKFSGGGLEHAALVGSGPFPNQGSKQIPKIRELHAKHSAQIVANNRVNK